MIDVSTAKQLPAIEKKILLVEDELVFARAVQKHLRRAGYVVSLTTTLKAARDHLLSEPPDLVLLDMRLPDGSGLDLLMEYQQQTTLGLPVLVMSAYGELEDAVAAMKLGASDYLKKPVDLEELLVNVKKLFQQANLSRQLKYSSKREKHAVEAVERVQLLGECPAIQGLKKHVTQIVGLSNSALVPATVLILGETGTGKDVLARLLHSKSPHADRPFVHVDCASLPKELIESELFGHEKGAFTSAHTSRIGLIEAAEDGVLFLDEIGELPMELQSRLLVVLERRVLRRIGTSKEQPVHAWIIAATNRDLEQQVQQNQFRSDLYYRLNVLNLYLPPLRERGQDVMLLARHFASHTAHYHGLDDVSFTKEAAHQLLSAPWLGNIRELKHTVERAVLLSGGGVIDQGMLLASPSLAPASVVVTDQPIRPLVEAEVDIIKQALEKTGGNVSKAARELGISRMALRYRIKKYGL